MRPPPPPQPSPLPPPSQLHPHALSQTRFWTLGADRCRRVWKINGQCVEELNTNYRSSLNLLEPFSSREITTGSSSRPRSRRAILLGFLTRIRYYLGSLQEYDTTWVPYKNTILLGFLTRIRYCLGSLQEYDHSGLHTISNCSVSKYVTNALYLHKT